MNSEKRAIIIFQKNPELGKVKTRLAQTTGDEEALKIYEYLIDRTLESVEDLNADKLRFFSSFIPDCNANPSHFYFLQKDGNLGDKMQDAFGTAFDMEYSKVLIIGTDCPEISTELLESAFDSLEQSQITIGPATDGGYYLLGMRNYLPELFDGINWSTALVLKETISKIKEIDSSYMLLKTLSDIDTEADWNAYLIRNETVYK